MAKTEQLVWNLAEPIVQECGCSIYDVEFIKEGKDWYLRVFIDRPEGVSTDDCEAVSRRLSDVLDEKDPIPQSYFLEISSPGLDRKLSLESHFLDSIGKKLVIKLYSPIQGAKSMEGILKGYADHTMELECEDGTILKIEKSKAADIRWHVQW